MRVNLKYDSNLLDTCALVKQHKVTLCALWVTTDYSSESLGKGQDLNWDWQKKIDYLSPNTVILSV